MVALSKLVAIQFATHNIRSNVTFPSPALLPMQKRWHDDLAWGEMIAGYMPFKRLYTPRDMTSPFLPPNALYNRNRIDGGWRPDGPALGYLFGHLFAAPCRRCFCVEAKRVFRQRHGEQALGFLRRVIAAPHIQ